MGALSARNKKKTKTKKEKQKKQKNKTLPPPPRKSTLPPKTHTNISFDTPVLKPCLWLMYAYHLY